MEIEIKPFTKVLDDSTRKFKKIPKGDYLEEGLYPIIDQSKNFIAGYTNNESLVNNENLPVIIFGDHTRALKYVDFPIALGADGAKALTIKSNDLYPKYLYYALKNLALPDAGYSRHFKFLKESKLPIPKEIDDQKRIAQVLSDCEALIAQRKESIALLDELLKSTFLEMFGVPFENTKNWQTEKLGNVIEVGTGGTPSRKKDAIYYGGNVNWAKTTEVNGTKIWDTKEKITYQAIEESNCKIHPIETILIAMYGQGKTRGNVGILQVEAATNQACAALPPSNDINQNFLFELLKVSYRYLRGLARGGNQENLNLTIIKNIDLILPPNEIQEQFANIVDKIENIKMLYRNHLIELEHLYGRLRQDAFKGDLDLSEVLIKEELEK